MFLRLGWGLGLLTISHILLKNKRSVLHQERYNSYFIINHCPRRVTVICLRSIFNVLVNVINYSLFLRMLSRALSTCKRYGFVDES